jgi:hypothetical protein
MGQENKKSTFITVLAWILIVLTGFSTLITIMQNIMVQLMFDKNEFRGGLDSPDEFPDIIFANFHVFMFLMGLIIIYSFISAIGLLKRKNWARISYVGLFGFGILYMLSMVGYQYVFFDNNSMWRSPMGKIDPVFITMGIFTLIFTLGMSFLFGWLIKRLTSGKVKQEFIVVMD